ncbi:glycosyltransferase family 2 protein [Roseibium suaedae]|uniref:Glycosyl transferase family 2 n=1 Tax=Roseibium suaedae TaxID=735517 RepID=A0A1M7MX33_9HYPH|nr:glycosyltransferase family 2 protein [Roseibium suaedae]SHM95732.1 Glycosyl transferase family 2 [Roseibium suaedae]
MKIHLHCVNWNSIEFIDYFFRHYDGFVSRYFVNDDGSTDGSLEYLSRRPDVTLAAKPRLDSESYVLESLHSHLTSWKRSAGLADWVIVVDMDEHIYHPDLPLYLERVTREGVTAIPALGFQMLSRKMPDKNVRLTDEIRVGAPWKQMSKLVMFRPDAVLDPGFAIGRHTAEPKGDIRYPDRDELLLLHYKYIGFDALKLRHAQAQARRRKADLQNGWGHRYAFDEQKLEEDFSAFEARSLDVSGMRDPHLQHEEPRWWR